MQFSSESKFSSIVGSHKWGVELSKTIYLSGGSRKSGGLMLEGGVTRRNGSDVLMCGLLGF